VRIAGNADGLAGHGVPFPGTSCRFREPRGVFRGLAPLSRCRR
jgi:hypothetical protein